MDDLYSSIGKLIVKFQELEFVASAFLIELLKVDYDKGLSLTAEMSFSRLVAALKSVTHTKFKKCTIRDEIDKICSQMSSCEQYRNRFIHSLYALNNLDKSDKPYTRSKIKAKFKKGLEKSIEFFDVDEIDKVTEKIVMTESQMLTVARDLQKRKIIGGLFFKN